MSEKYVTGTQFNYYLICHRKLWLFSRGITMEHQSDLVLEGKLIHEESYPRRDESFEEIEIDGIKIDFFDPKSNVIHEIKKSNRFEDAHLWQLKYYISILKDHGLNIVTGLLEYPRLRRTESVILTEDDRTVINEKLVDIRKITDDEKCPDRKKITACKNCSYFDFCWSGESDESTRKPT